MPVMDAFTALDSVHPTAISPHSLPLPKWTSHRRKRLRALIAPYVADGVSTVSWLQHRCRSPLLDLIMRTASVFGTHNFYVSVLPLGFWLGYASVSINLVMLMCLGIYLGNVLKDFFSLPRPTAPPVARLVVTGAFEFGMPSTHAVNAVMFAPYLWLHFYVLDRTRHPVALYLEWPLLAAALSLTALICFSRLYLGMHCVADVLGGLLLGVAVMWVWVSGLGDALELWMLHGTLVPLVMVPVCLLMLFLHPVALQPCTCYADSVCFIGTIYGAVCALWSLTHVHSIPTGMHGAVLYSYAKLGLVGTLVRFAVGLSIVVVTRGLLKAGLNAVLPRVLADRSPHPCDHNLHLGKNEEQLRDFLSNTKDRSPDWSLAQFRDTLDPVTVNRLIRYAGVGYSALFLAPAVFHFAGL